MKTIRKKSPIPFLVAGLAGLLYGLRVSIYRPVDYLKLGLLAFVVYWLGRIFWKDRMVQVDVAPKSGDASADALINEARGALGRIHSANDAIADPGLSRTIDKIESNARELLLMIEEKPALQTQLRTFLRYYLPTTVKILDARASLEPGRSSASQAAYETRERTERMLTQIETAMTKQIDALEKNRYLDVQVEMDVLEGMLKSNGLTSGSVTST